MTEEEVPISYVEQTEQTENHSSSISHESKDLESTPKEYIKSILVQKTVKQWSENNEVWNKLFYFLC